MQIRQFRVVLRARDFDHTCRFYGEVLSLPRLRSWDREDGRGAHFQAGNGVVEVLGVAHQGLPLDPAHAFQGPDQKLVLSLIVASAEKAYDELILRDKNIPGGLRRDPDGSLVFETRDPDGVRITLREAAH